MSSSSSSSSSSTVPQSMTQKSRPISEIPTKTSFGRKIKGFLMQQEMHSKEPTQMKKETNRSISMSPFDLIAYEYQIPINNKHKDKEGNENNKDGDKDDDKDDTDDDDFLALPSTIARSKQEVGPSDPDDCNYILPLTC